MKEWLKKHAAWTLPVGFVLLLTPFTPWLDLTIAKYFYKGNGSFTNNAFTEFWYNYGVIPAQLLGIFSAVVYLLSFCLKRLKPWRRPAFVLVLTMIIGAGFIVHTVFKDHWGRPRPKQVVEFGGTQEFRPYYKPNFFLQPEPSKSFTCGHCTMGFYFFALALVGKRLNNRMLLWSGIALSIVAGFSLSYTRIAQGGHFFSDTLFTALIMWLVAYACDKLVYSEQPKIGRSY